MAGRSWVPLYELGQGRWRDTDGTWKWRKCHKCQAEAVIASVPEKDSAGRLYYCERCARTEGAFSW